MGGIFSFLPWFANGSGLAYFLGSPSAGFLWGFLPMVVITGYLSNTLSGQGNIIKILVALVFGQLALYSFGLTHAYLLVLPFVDWMNTPSELMKIYVYPFIIGDLLKTFIVALVTIYFTKKITKLN